MVTGGAVDEAVRLAKEMPRLAVGLHVVVAGAAPALPPRDIPHLVDRQGELIGDPVSIGLRYCTSRTAQTELRRELEAQFERFDAAGLPLSHVDGHLHMHMHPTVFAMLVPLADAHGACGLRLPHDEPRLAFRHDGSRRTTKVIWSIVFALLRRGRARMLTARGLKHAARVYGVLQTGRMTEAYVTDVLRSSMAETAEMYFHPATEASGEPMGPNPGDLATLLSTSVMATLHESGGEPSTYSALPGARP
jgi:hopanoid biosynthesis associated protein HpnK